MRVALYIGADLYGIWRVIGIQVPQAQRQVYIHDSHGIYHTSMFGHHHSICILRYFVDMGSYVVWDHVAVYKPAT